MKRHRLLVLAAALAVGSDLRAQVDQANWSSFPNLGGVNLRYDPRQEFTPSLSALDSVVLSVGRFATTSPGGTLAVSIRQGGIDGPVIGTSDSVSLPAFFRGDVLFRFPEQVALVPRSPYALQPISVAGNNQWLLDTDTGGSYTGGRLFFDGSFLAQDLLFMEGVGIPEPASIALLVLGACILLPIAVRCRYVKRRNDDGYYKAVQRIRRLRLGFVHAFWSPDR